MSNLTLVIGNKNYSSWSLRPWFLLTALEIPFTEERIALGQPDTHERILAASPSGKVPALRDGSVTVWESLAICEYVAERFPDRPVWPRDAAARATARSISAEMHAGFLALRTTMPMNCRATGRRAVRSEAVVEDIARIESIWLDCRRRFGGGGPWLFGSFSAADAMFAPVAFRFATYGMDGNETTRAYVRTVLDDPHIERWRTAAAAEPEVMPMNEAGAP